MSVASESSTAKPMSLHHISGNRRLGTALASITMLMWGTLPIALAILFDRLAPETLVWFRFVVSSLLLGAALALRGELPALTDLGRRGVQAGRIDRTIHRV